MASSKPKYAAMFSYIVYIKFVLDQNLYFY
jgi:hypothetical protein